MVVLSEKERSVYKAFETLYSGVCLAINVTGIRFDIRIIESKVKVTFLTCCHKIMPSQFIVQCAKISRSSGSMFTYKAATPKGFSDAFICMKRHENISYISKWFNWRSVVAFVLGNCAKDVSLPKDRKRKPFQCNF